VYVCVYIYVYIFVVLYAFLAQGSVSCPLRSRPYKLVRTGMSKTVPGADLHGDKPP